MLQSATFAQIPGQQDTVRLKFSDFSVAEKWIGKPAAVNLSSDPQARTYRTLLIVG